MGLVDTVENVAPICPTTTPNSGNPQTTPPNNNNCQPPHSNLPAPYPNYGFQPAYGAYGNMINSSGSMNKSGIQKNGDTKVGNRSQQCGGVKIDSIGSNLDNQFGQQIVGDVKVGNIGC